MATDANGEWRWGASVAEFSSHFADVSTDIFVSIKEKGKKGKKKKEKKKEKQEQTLWNSERVK
ncbi:MAG: hypothetical protein Q8P67_28110 [archaeon]|nr:hypothetical protein [archaeon]